MCAFVSKICQKYFFLFEALKDGWLVFGKVAKLKISQKCLRNMFWRVYSKSNAMVFVKYSKVVITIVLRKKCSENCKKIPKTICFKTLFLREKNNLLH